ncbi:MAG TPA: tRNA lysidine(34) synthetase TilS [Gemmatimonadales bacterium]|nr:tRNA lysidine(34) synthetase TilS [Gemmatimonadales bacterium]
MTLGLVERMDLENQFSRVLSSLGIEHTHLIVAVSGGGDSVALLTLLARCAPLLNLTLTAGHVDHGIATTSAEIARGVEQLAKGLGLPSRVIRLELGADAGETAARSARWSALERMRAESEADFIVTAHHQDDQAETVLMRVLKGTGPAGLAGMQARTGTILRPLLPFRRAELAQYLHDHGLAGWSDPANMDQRHDRAWVRHRLLPLLRERWPDVTDELNRVAAAALEWRRAWNDTLSQLPGLDLQQERDGISVAGGPLAGYSSDMARAVVRTLALRVGLVVSSRNTQRVLKLVAGGRSGSWVPLGRHYRAALAFGRLRIERPGPAPEPVVLRHEPAELQWGGWTFRVSREAAPAMHDRRAMTAWLPLDAVVLRSRKAGDRMQPLGGPGHRTIARLLQEARVPLGQRDSWPVLEVNGAPIWIPGVCRSQLSVPDPGSEALRIDADHR